MWRSFPLVVTAAGLVFGAASLALARNEPAYGFAGASTGAGAAELVVGYALLAAGLVASMRRSQRVLGAILIAAAFAWFLPEWNNAATGSAIVFTLALVFSAAAPPLAAHAVLGYPDGRVRSWPTGLGLAVAYASAILVLGVLAASVYDPAAGGCQECPRNLLLVDDNPAAHESLIRIGMYMGLGSALLLILLALTGLVRSTPARRHLAGPVVVAGCAYLGLVAADFAHSRGRGSLVNDVVDRRLWLGEAAALFALALAVAWSWVRGRRKRSQIARLVLQLAGAPPVGGLRDVLSRTLGDPSLQLGYPVGEGRFVDAQGLPLRLEGEATPLVRGGQMVALLSHRPGLLDDTALGDEVAAAARLALENERLQAETCAQLEDLRASRLRIVEAGDAERRRLERDLHDGAQQRLVALSLALRLARSSTGVKLDRALLERVDEAETELRGALEELRELAHGIFPAALADEGLAAAIETLAEGAPIPLEITALPDERLDASVEAAAYFVVSETLRQSAASALRVSAARRDGHLVVEVEGDGEHVDLVDLEDRVGALNGSLYVVRDPGGTVTIRAEIPCES